MNKDFFDEEFEKKEKEKEQSEQQQQALDNKIKEWNETPVYSAPNPTINKKRSTTNIILAVLLAIVCLALGIFTGLLINVNSSETKEQSYILEQVLSALDGYYYEDISAEEWEQILTNGGTGMLHTLDNFGYLLSPQQYYNLINPSAQEVPGLVFGFSYTQTKHLGLVVSSVKTDSSVYGILEAGDIITDVFDKNGNPITYDVILDENGVITAVTTGNAYSLYVPATPINIIAAVLSMQNNLGGYVHNSVSINYIRGGSEVYSYEDGVHYDNVSITRGLLDNNTNNADNFQFIEYYFGAEKTNCSPKTQSIRNLQQVSPDTGYIRISEFSAISYNKEGVTVTTSASKEFALAMDMFKSLGKKYLILDLKENPGGDIEIAKEIASFLIYNKVEGASQKNLRVTSLIGKNINEIYTVTSQYSNYFDVTGDTKDTPHNKISILTDGNSASASELLTGAILSYGTGVQVGSTTYGKGIAQTAIPLTKYPKTIEVNGTQITSYYAIYLTIAKYYLPDEQNTNIHGVGLTPLAENIVESKPLSTDTYASLINKAQSLFVK